MKPFRLIFSKEAKIRIQHLPPTIKREMRACLDELKENPWEGKILQRELTGLFSLRIKNYRVLYQIDDERRVIDILTLGLRKTIYEETSKKYSRS